jgi:hypothetical protein
VHHGGACPNVPIMRGSDILMFHAMFLSKIGSLGIFTRASSALG